jgi:hypothetical protein
MKLECYAMDGQDVDIRPGGTRRGWMDSTSDRFAYRCLPLSIANAHGWVLCCRGSFDVEWNGGSGDRDVSVTPVGDGPLDAEGHFGNGVLTIYPRALFRTEPGYNLWITGPPNEFKDGIQALSAVVETDWMPYHFTMNWKFTRPDLRIRFAKGEPYCFLFPVKRGVPEAMEPVLMDLSDNPEINRQVHYADNMRGFKMQVKQMLEREGKKAALENEKELTFQKWYMRGDFPDGSEAFGEHQKSLQLRPFRDRRRSPESVPRADDPPGS